MKVYLEVEFAIRASMEEDDSLLKGCHLEEEVLLVAVHFLGFGECFIPFRFMVDQWLVRKFLEILVAMSTKHEDSCVWASVMLGEFPIGLIIPSKVVC